MQIFDQPQLPPTLEAFVDKGKLAWPAGTSGVLPGVIVHPSLQAASPVERMSLIER